MNCSVWLWWWICKLCGKLPCVVFSQVWLNAHLLNEARNWCLMFTWNLLHQNLSFYLIYLVGRRLIPSTVGLLCFPSFFTELSEHDSVTDDVKKKTEIVIHFERNWFCQKWVMLICFNIDIMYIHSVRFDVDGNWLQMDLLCSIWVYISL